MKEYAECFRNKLNQINVEWKGILEEEGIERKNVVIFGLKNTTMIHILYITAKNDTGQNRLNKMLLMEFLEVI